MTLPATKVRAAVAWPAAVICLLWALARTFGVESGYPAVAVMAYTLHIVPIAVIGLIVALALRQWAAAAVAGVALALLLIAIAPRAVGGADAVEGRELRVMSSNVLRGRGDEGQLIDLVREHDVEVLVVQELTPEFHEAFRTAGADRLLPHSRVNLKKDVSGSGIYSMYPVGPLQLGGDVFGSQRGQVTVDAGLQLDVTSVHPLLPSTPRNTDGWEAELETLPAPSEDAVSLLLGDFNATFDHAEFREIIDLGYADAGERMGDGLIPTWPAKDKPWRYLPVTIDHLLYDENKVGVRDYQVLDVDGTDHKALYAEFVIRE